jgi:subtilase-type serine protease
MLASTAFTGAFIAAIAGNPDSALAACVVTSNPNTVTCDNTVTNFNDNIDAATSPSSSKHQRFTTGGDVNVTINAGQTVSGQGLVVINDQAGTGTTVTNNGAVITDDPVLAGFSGPLTILGAGGTINYRGNGSSQTTLANHSALGISHSGASGTINIGTSSAPISGLFSADSAISAATQGGEIHAHLHGGSLSASGSMYAFGLYLVNELSAGNINATLTGNTAINTTTTAGFFDAAGIHAQNTSSGNVTVTSDANIGLTGTAFRFGIHANASAGNVSVTQTGGTIFASGPGIWAEASGNITVTQSGGQIGSASQPAAGGIQATSSAGTINVTAKDISAYYNAVYAIIDGGTGNLSITSNGALSASGAAIKARNDGTGSITVNTAAGSAVTGGGGIEADSGAGGAINITNAGTISTSQAYGISAASSGNIVVTSTGVIAANWTGIDAQASGSGNVTVNVANDVTTGIGGAVRASAVDGNVAVNVTGGTVRGTLGYGVQVGSSTGNAFVTIGAGATVHGVEISGTGKTLDNGGAIVGDAVFHDSNSLFVMNGPSASLTGMTTVQYGTGTLRFAGHGTNSFDLSKLDASWTLIDKTGSSNWSLTGATTYTGAVTINGGTLSVNTDLTTASGITVNSGALGGGGTVGNVTINAGGGLAPGNSIGVLNIAGNLSFVGAGNYIVEVDGANADKTIVGGTATLDGKVVVTPLSRVTAKTTYNILTATTINGAFNSAVMANNFGRNPTLSDDGFGNIFLTVDVGFLSPILTGAVTPNQSSVANAIDNHLLGGSNIPAAFDALFTLSPGGLKSALDQLSGEVHASTTSLLADEAGYARNAILGRLRQASYGGTMGAMASLTVGGPQAFSGEDDLGSALAFAKSPIVRKAPLRASAAQNDIVFWAQGFGAWGRFNGDGNAASVRRDLAGFFTGIDTRAGDAGRVGIAAGYTGSKTNSRGSSNVDTAHIAAYGGWSLSALNLRAGGAFAAHSINTDRTIKIPGFFDRTFANYGGHTGQVFGELGYGFALASMAIEAFAGAAWVRVHTDGATERGGAAALNVAGTTFETGTTTLGIRAASMAPVGDNMILIPRTSLAWQHAFGGTTPSTTLAFAAMPASPFTVSGVPIARDALLAEAALDLAVGRHATLGVSYTGQIARNVADHGAKGKFSYRF